MKFKVKRLKKIKINSMEFKIVWDSSCYGGWFSYGKKEIGIGTKSNDEAQIWMILCHEIKEVIAEEFNVRFRRPDCDSDYLFVYDHRQFDTMMAMFSGVISEFVT